MMLKRKQGRGQWKKTRDINLWSLLVCTYMHTHTHVYIYTQQSSQGRLLTSTSGLYLHVHTCAHIHSHIYTHNIIQFEMQLLCLRWNALHEIGSRLKTKEENTSEPAIEAI